MTTVTVLSPTGPTGPAGTLEKVYIYAGPTGATGCIPIWLQAALGATGFKQVVDITALGVEVNVNIKKVIINGYTGPHSEPPAEFDPITLFSGGAAGLWLDPSDSATTFQNSGLSTPAVSGDPLGGLSDKSGNSNNVLQATSGRRPTLTNVSGKWYFETDGVDDSLQSLFTIAQPYYLFIAVNIIDWSNGSQLISGGNANAGVLYRNNDYISMYAGEGAPSALFLASTNHVITAYFNGASSFLRFNGVQQGTTADAGSINPGGITLGSYFGGSSPSAARFFGVIMTDKVLSAQEITDTETYLTDLLPAGPAATFLARTAGLDATHTDAYTDLIDGLVADGVWSAFDALYIFATQDSTTALLNLVSTSFNGTAVDAPTFAANQGYIASSTTSYIETGFNPTTAPSPKYTQDDAHLAVWNNTDATDTNAILGSSLTHLNMYVKYADDHFYSRVNDASAGGGYSYGDPRGLLVGQRTSSVAIAGYQNGTELGHLSETSGSVVNASIKILSPDVSGADTIHQIAAVSFGRALTGPELTAYYDRMLTFMVAVGAVLDGSESDGSNLLAGGVGMTSDWGTVGTTFTNATTTAPDGTSTGSTCAEASSDSRHTIYNFLASADLNSTRHFSIYAKMNGRRYLQCLPSSGSVAKKVYAYFDLQAGTVTDSAALNGATSISNVTITPAVNGYYKCEFDFVLGSGATDSVYCSVALSDVGTYGEPLSADQPQYLGDGSSGAYLWRGKLT